MAERDGVLRQKLTPVTSPPPGQMSAEKALAIAFGRAARDVPGLGMRMAGFARSRAELQTMSRLLEGGSLGMLLVQRGAAKPPEASGIRTDIARPTSRLGSGQRGLGRDPAPPEAAVMHGGMVIADAGLVAALVEARMTGHVSPAEPLARDPTRIDALIVASLIDAALVQFDRLVPDMAIAPLVSNWRAGAMVPSALSARLTLREGEFMCFTLDFDLAEGARQGRLTLALPDRLAPEAEDTPESGQKANELAQIVLQTRSDLRAVLARMQVPLSRLSGWQAGHTIPIPRAALSGVRIEDIEGGLVSRGRLGQLAGARAIRIASIEPGSGEPGFAITADPSLERGGGSYADRL